MYPTPDKSSQYNEIVITRHKISWYSEINEASTASHLNLVTDNLQNHAITNNLERTLKTAYIPETIWALSVLFVVHKRRSLNNHVDRRVISRAGHKRDWKRACRPKTGLPIIADTCNRIDRVLLFMGPSHKLASRLVCNGDQGHNGVRHTLAISPISSPQVT